MHSSTRQRLLTLVTKLQLEPQRQELLNQDPWNPRLLEEDLRSLKSLGFPVHYSRTSCRYSLQPFNHSPSPLNLSQSELIELLLELPAGEGSLAQVRETFKHRLLSPDVHHHAFGPFRKSEFNLIPEFDLIREAVWTRRRIEGSYTKDSGAISNRHLEPYKIVSSPLSHYLFAWDRSSSRYSFFRLDRLSHCRLATGKPFKARPDAQSFLEAHLKRSWYIAASPVPCTVRILFTGHAASVIGRYRFHPSQQLESCSEGLIASFQLSTALFEFRSWLMQWLPDFQILSPQSLKNEVSQLLIQGAQHETRKA